MKRKRALVGFDPTGILCAAPDGGGGGGSAAPAEKSSGPTLNHSQCVKRQREITTELERLGEMDDLSPEDEGYFYELTSEFEQVDKHRKNLERQRKIDEVRSAAKGANLSNLRPGSQIQPGASDSDTYAHDAFVDTEGLEDVRYRSPWDLSNMRVFGRSREDINLEMMSRARSAIEQMPQATDRIKAAATDILEKFEDKDAKISRMVLAASSPEYVRAFAKMAQNSPHLLTEPERRALDSVRAMSLTDSAGGYLVPFQLDPTVIITSNGSRNDIRRVARQVVATGDVWHGVSAGAVSWSWDTEAEQVSDDAPTFAQPVVNVYKAQGFVPISIEALEDEQNVAGAVASLLAQGREDLEAPAFVTGTGASGNQPIGIVTALTGGSSVVASTTTDTFAVGDVYKVHDALPARYRGRSNWLASNGFYSATRQFDTAGGSSLWAQLGADRPASLLGRGVYEAEDMDGTVTADEDNYLAVVGDWQYYVIADRIGMTVEFIPHLFQQTTAGSGIGRPTGQRGWFAYYRVGADSVNDGAFRMLNVT